jgi:hypothetical protein
MTEQTTPQRAGTSRRDFLRRSAIVGGTLVWTAPVVQTLARPAFAAHTSPLFSVLRRFQFNRSNDTWTLAAEFDLEPACPPAEGWSGIPDGTSTQATVTQTTVDTTTIQLTNCQFHQNNDVKGRCGTGTPANCQTGTIGDPPTSATIVRCPAGTTGGRDLVRIWFLAYCDS